MFSLVVGMIFILHLATSPAPEPILTHLTPPVRYPTVLPAAKTVCLRLCLVENRLELPLVVVLVLPKTHIAQVMLFFAAPTLKVKALEVVLPAGRAVDSF